MTGHWICDSCGYDGEHASYCRYLRPANEQWMGNRTRKEMDDLRKAEAVSSSLIDRTEKP